MNNNIQTNNKNLNYAKVAIQSLNLLNQFKKKFLFRRVFKFRYNESSNKYF